MLHWQRWILKSPLKGKVASYLGIQGDILKSNKIDLWFDCFGNPENPAFLLIMGAGCQGILWTGSFCRKLAEQGFFVIRFDNRDVGFSSYCNYKKDPYTFKDMALDALGLLDALGIDKAHLMGISMGGAIAQIMATLEPSRVKSLTLISTTSDFRPLASVADNLSFQGLTLSAPTKEWFQWMVELEKLPSLAIVRKVKKHLEGWELLNGGSAPFEREYYKGLMKKSLSRQRSHLSFLNHRSALLASLDILRDTQGKINAPSLVIHGSKDPLIPKDHGEYLASSIPGSSLMLIETMGHNMNRCFYDEILEEAVTLAKKSEG